MSSKKTKHIYNKQEVDTINHIIKFLDDHGESNLAILFKAILAGITQKEEYIRQFVKAAFESGPQSLRAESIMVLIRLLIDSGNFQEARKFAADLSIMEHHVIHALARCRIAKFSQDTEDSILAAETIEEIIQLHFNKNNKK